MDGLSVNSDSTEAEEEALTSETLTIAQISQLRAAWQAEHDELLKYKEACSLLQSQVNELTSQLYMKNEDHELESVKSSLSLVAANYPAKPFVLLEEVLQLIPSPDISVSCIIKTGSSYQILSSASQSEDTVGFESKTFDEYLRSRVYLSIDNEVSIEDMHALLPPNICAYIQSGSAEGAASEVLQTPQKNAFIDQATASKIAVIRRNSLQDVEDQRRSGDDSILNRCVWILHSRNNLSLDLASTPYATGRYAPPLSGSGSVLSDLLIAMFGEDAEETPASAYWSAILLYCNSLILSLLLQSLEAAAKQAEVTRLQVTRAIQEWLFLKSADEPAAVMWRDLPRSLESIANGIILAGLSDAHGSRCEAFLTPVRSGPATEIVLLSTSQQVVTVHSGGRSPSSSAGIAAALASAEGEARHQSSSNDVLYSALTSAKVSLSTFSAKGIVNTLIALPVAVAASPAMDCVLLFHVTGPSLGEAAVARITGLLTDEVLPAVGEWLLQRRCDVLSLFPSVEASPPSAKVLVDLMERFHSPAELRVGSLHPDLLRGIAHQLDCDWSAIVVKREGLDSALLFNNSGELVPLPLSELTAFLSVSPGEFSKTSLPSLVDHPLYPHLDLSPDLRSVVYSLSKLRGVASSYFALTFAVSESVWVLGGRLWRDFTNLAPLTAFSRALSGHLAAAATHLTLKSTESVKQSQTVLQLNNNQQSELVAELKANLASLEQHPPQQVLWRTAFLDVAAQFLHKMHGVLQTKDVNALGLSHISTGQIQSVDLLLVSSIASTVEGAVASTESREWLLDDTNGNWRAVCAPVPAVSSSSSTGDISPRYTGGRSVSSTIPTTTPMSQRKSSNGGGSSPRSGGLSLRAPLQKSVVDSSNNSSSSPRQPRLGSPVRFNEPPALEVPQQESSVSLFEIYSQTVDLNTDSKQEVPSAAAAAVDADSSYFSGSSYSDDDSDTDERRFGGAAVEPAAAVAKAVSQSVTVRLVVRVTYSGPSDDSSTLVPLESSDCYDYWFDTLRHAASARPRELFLPVSHLVRPVDDQTAAQAVENLIVSCLRHQLHSSPSECTAHNVETHYLRDRGVLSKLGRDVPGCSNFILIPITPTNPGDSNSQYTNMLVEWADACPIPNRFVKHLNRLLRSGLVLEDLHALPQDITTSLYNYIITLNDESIDREGFELNTVFARYVNNRKNRSGDELLVSCLDTTNPLYLFLDASGGPSLAENAPCEVFYLVVPRKDRVISPYTLDLLRRQLHSLFNTKRLVHQSGLNPLLDCTAGIERLVAVSLQDTSKLRLESGSDVTRISTSSSNCVVSSTEILLECVPVIQNIINSHATDGYGACLSVSAYTLPMTEQKAENGTIELVRCDTLHQRKTSQAPAAQLDRLFCPVDARTIRRMYNSSLEHAEDSEVAKKVHYVVMSGVEFNTSQLIAENSGSVASAATHSHAVTAAANAQQNALLLRQDVTVLQVFISANLRTSEAMDVSTEDSVVASLVIFLSAKPVNAAAVPNAPVVSPISGGLMSYLTRIVDVASTLVINHYSTLYHIQQNNQLVNVQHQIVVDHNTRLLQTINEWKGLLERTLVDMEGSLPEGTRVDAQPHRQSSNDVHALVNGDKSPSRDMDAEVHESIHVLQDTINGMILQYQSTLHRLTTSEAHLDLVKRNYEHSIRQYDNVVNVYNWFVSTVPKVSLQESLQTDFLLLPHHPSHAHSIAYDLQDTRSQSHFVRVEPIEQMLVKTILFTLSVNTKLLQQTLNLVATDYHHYEHLSSFLQDIVHCHTEQHLIRDAKSDSGGKVIATPEQVTIVWCVEEFLKNMHGEDNVFNHHSASGDIYSAGKLAQSVASQETVSVEGADLRHLLQKGSSRNLKARVPVAYGSEISSIVYHPVVVDSGYGRVVVAVVQYVIFKAARKDEDYSFQMLRSHKTIESLVSIIGRGVLAGHGHATHYHEETETASETHSIEDADTDTLVVSEDNAASAKTGQRRQVLPAREYAEEEEEGTTSFASKPSFRRTQFLVDEGTMTARQQSFRQPLVQHSDEGTSPMTPKPSLKNVWGPPEQQDEETSTSSPAAAGITNTRPSFREVPDPILVDEGTSPLKAAASYREFHQPRRVQSSEELLTLSADDASMDRDELFMSPLSPSPSPRVDSRASGSLSPVHHHHHRRKSSHTYQAHHVSHSTSSHHSKGHVHAHHVRTTHSPHPHNPAIRASRSGSVGSDYSGGSPVKRVTEKKLCSVVQTESLLRAMNVIIGDPTTGGIKIPPLEDNRGMKQHLSDVIGELAASTLRGDAGLFYLNSGEDSSNSSSGSPLRHASSHSFATLNYSGLIHRCVEGGRYVTAHPSGDLAHLNTGTYPPLFSLLEQLSTQAKQHASFFGIPDEVVPSHVTLHDTSILHSVGSPSRSRSSDAAMNHILIAPLSLKYRPLSFAKAKSPLRDSSGHPDVLLIVEMPHKISTHTLRCFDTVLNTLQAMVATYHYRLQLQLQHTEINSISSEFATTAQQLVSVSGQQKHSQALIDFLRAVDEPTLTFAQWNQVVDGKGLLEVVGGAKSSQLVAVTAAVEREVSVQVSKGKEAAALLATGGPRTVQPASYFFGTQYLQEAQSSADLSISVQKLAALATLTHTIIVCDAKQGDGDDQQGSSSLRCSLFIPIVAHADTARKPTEGMTLDGKLSSVQAQADEVVCSARGFALHVVFPSVNARTVYLTGLTQTVSGSGDIASGSLFGTAVEAIVAQLGQFVRAHRQLALAELTKCGLTFADRISGVSGRVLQAVSHFSNTPAEGDDAKAASNSMTLEKASAIVNHVLKLEPSADPFSWESRVHWQPVSDDDGEPLPSVNSSSYDSRSGSPVPQGIATPTASKWVACVAKSVGSLTAAQMSGQPEAAAPFLGDMTLQLLAHYNHHRVRGSDLSEAQIYDTLKAEHGVLCSANDANPLTSSSATLLIDISTTVGERLQRAILEVVITFNREKGVLSSTAGDSTLASGVLMNIPNFLQWVVEPAVPAFSVLGAALSDVLAANIKRLQHAAAIRALVGDISTRTERVTLLNKVLTLLTTEGNKPTTLLQSVQDVLRHLPNIHSSAIACKDVVTDSVIYEASMVYEGASAGQTIVTGGLFSAPATPAASFYAGQATPVTPSRGLARTVSFIDASHPASVNKITSPIITTLDPHNNISASASLGPRGFSQLLTPSPLDRAKSFSVSSTPNKGAAAVGRSGIPTPRSAEKSKSFRNLTIQVDEPSVFEFVFECYEIQGTLTIQFTDKHEQEEDIRHSYHTDTIADEGVEDTYSEIYTLQIITRALARRVFELHRGNKNKKLMAIKQEEIHLRNYQLAQKEEHVETLEQAKTRTEQELSATSTEADKLRHMMAAETGSLKEALRQKKEMNAHLRTSMIDLRRESEKKESALLKQVHELKEGLRLANMEKNQIHKDVKKTEGREKAAEATATELTFKANDLQRQLVASQSSVQLLTAQVNKLSSEKDMLAGERQSAAAAEDNKLRVMLAKLKGLEDEMVTLRGTNAFLKKQLDSSTTTVQTLQRTHSSHVMDLQSKMQETHVKTAKTDENNQNLLQELHRTEQELHSLTEQLKREQNLVDEQRKKIREMEGERSKLAKSWKDVKSAVI